MTNTKTFKYGLDKLTVGIALNIARGKTKGIIDKNAEEKINKSKEYVEKIVKQKDVVYGINTGFGPLCTTVISEEDTLELQYNILKSHSVGMGENIEKEIAKLMMILKVHSLSFGYSGTPLQTLERIMFFIENDIIPCVPEQGSVGASGDLAPLAHLFLPLIGLGTVEFENKIYESQEILDKFSLEPIKLGPKEGLALINGTQFIAAHAVKVAERMQNCLDNADIIAAMNIEAMKGSVRPFLPELHELRPYEGNKYVAFRISEMLKGSEILHSHQDCDRVQDPYSLRCVPQVHGASRNAWLHLNEMLEIELNSVTDNPVIFDENHTISGGNFHGQPMALPLDYAAFAISEIGNISDRRIYLSLGGKIEGLPKLLLREAGLNSGFMMPQYTSAAIASENKTLCFPASADSIPTSMGQEDHVSMGSISARKALKIIENVEKILGIELFCAAQAFEYRKPLKSAPVLEACQDHVRTKIKFAESDRIFSTDMKIAFDMVKKGEMTKVVNEIKTTENILNQFDKRFGIY